MFLGGTKSGPTGANPFKEKVSTGPGTGTPELFTAAWSRRRRYANQVLGDTPPRDGPFAQSAKPIAVAMPPKTRVEVRRAKEDPGGPNPFR